MKTEDEYINYLEGIMDPNKEELLKLMEGIMVPNISRDEILKLDDSQLAKKLSIIIPISKKE